MTTEHLDFVGATGVRLSGRLELPDGPVRATAVFAHCFTCGKDIAAARRIARELAARGIATLRFDFAGLGGSEGDFGTSGFAADVADLAAAAKALGARLSPPELLVGHSLGGAAALAAAPDIPSVRAVATIGAPAEVSHVLKHLGDAAEVAREHGEVEAVISGRSLTLGRAFIAQAEAAALAERLTQLRAAVLILHAPRDAVVGIENATRLFVAARHPKSFVTLDDADHLLSDPADAAYAADVIAAWAGRYLSPVKPETGAPEAPLRVSEVDPEGFLQHVTAGALHLYADEPASVGGSGKGLSPYQLVAAGLGACTSMTLRMYARRKGLALDHVSVEVSHAKRHADDCADCESKGAKIDVFHRLIRIEGDLSAEERQRLLQIADRCPVHRTLEASARIETVEAATSGDG
jgi:putative redox protein